MFLKKKKEKERKEKGPPSMKIPICNSSALGG